jgi:hypothetical protein
MRCSTRRSAALLLACVVWMGLSARQVATAPPPPPPPNPILVYDGPEFYQANGKQWIRYRYEVFNLTDYPNTMFAAAPDLPPCGSNTKSSRTWVDIYDQSGKRLYGFCALGDHDGLGKLWFALEEGVLPPSWIYIELNDRKTGTKYKSNLAETTL